MLRVWGHRGGVGPSGALDGPWRALGVLPGLCRGPEGLEWVWGPAEALPGVWGLCWGGWRP